MPSLVGLGAPAFMAVAATSVELRRVLGLVPPEPHPFALQILFEFGSEVAGAFFSTVDVII